MVKNQVNEEGIDLIKILKKLLSRWHILVISFMIALALGFLYNETSDRYFKVEAILKRTSEPSGTSKLLNTVGVQQEGANIEDEIIVIQSTEYIEEAINRLDFGVSYFVKNDIKVREIYGQELPFTVEFDSTANQLINVPINIDILSDSEFELSVDGENALTYNLVTNEVIGKRIPKIALKKRYKFGEPVMEENFGFTIWKGENAVEPLGKGIYFVVNSKRSQIKQYMRRLKIQSAGRNSNILRLSTMGTTVSKEIRFLNTLIDVIVEKDLNAKNLEGIKTIEFINFQLSKISDSLNKAERALESFQYTTTSIGEAGALYQKRDKLESELAAYNVKLSYFQNLLFNLESPSGVANVSSPGSIGVDDPVLSDLLIKITELNQRKTQLGNTVTDDNPVMKEVNLEIQIAKDALKKNVNNAIPTMDISIKDLNNRIAAINATINRLPSTERRRLGIERKFEYSDDTYDYLQERKVAAGLALATNVSDWRIIEWSSMVGNRPLTPNTKFIYLISVLLGLGVPAFFILVYDYFDNSVKGKEDLEKITRIPVLGMVNKAKKNSKVVVKNDENSSVIESWRSIRINLQYITNKDPGQIIGITSSTAGEGKTFCSANLAAIMAKSGKKVLLIDTDLRKSSMADYFNVDKKMGLSSYLIGKCFIMEVIQPSGIDNIDVILAGAKPPNPHELLNTDKMDELIEYAKGKYDQIILDSPPLGIVSDYLTMAKKIDTNIYIIKSNYTRRQHLEKINELYENQRLNNLSIILNSVKLSASYAFNGKAKDYYY